jgi:hypothetical protein
LFGNADESFNLMKPKWLQPLRRFGRRVLGIPGQTVDGERLTRPEQLNHEDLEDRKEIVS